MEKDLIDIKETQPNIVQITMQDRINKNGFSKEYVAAMIRIFKSIKLNQTFKVVILTGYDNYFSSGGTRDSLLDIHNGKTNVRDMHDSENINFYSLLLDCNIPVISAMQGHAIGGGFIFGLFADFIILSRESIYTTNFMKYGFTPGMGSTYILEKKLGFSMTQEMLFTAAHYRGAELEKRGVPFPVVPRKEVMNYSYQLANQLSEKPRASLIILKEHLNSTIRNKLPEIIEQEHIMHKKTFHQEEVKTRLMSLFGK